MAPRANLQDLSGAARRGRLGPPAERPADEGSENGDRHEAILDAAEHLFAMTGFAGTGMRAIADQAGVGQSLLHYHFGTKERLFEAMFARRAADWNRQRLQRLEVKFAVGKPKLEEFLEILLRPTVEFGRDGAKGSEHFARLIVATALGHDDRDRNLIKKYYDSFARHMIAVLRDCLPGISQKDAVWGYLFAMGVGITMMAPNDRAYGLSEGLCDDSNADDVLAHVVEFAAAGLRRLASKMPDRKKGAVGGRKNIRKRAKRVRTA